jgi:hypothetical protein
MKMNKILIQLPQTPGHPTQAASGFGIARSAPIAVSVILMSVPVGVGFFRLRKKDNE